jgi:hypothetical protein
MVRRQELIQRCRPELDLIPLRHPQPRPADDRLGLNLGLLRGHFTRIEQKLSDACSPEAQKPRSTLDAIPKLAPDDHDEQVLQ